MVIVTQLIYVHPGREADFHAFEDEVLPLLDEYGGELLLRLRPAAASKIAGSLEAPYEVHLVRFATTASLEGYANDGRRLAALHLKDGSVRETFSVSAEA